MSYLSCGSYLPCDQRYQSSVRVETKYHETSILCRTDSESQEAGQDFHSHDVDLARVTVGRRLWEMMEGIIFPFSQSEYTEYSNDCSSSSSSDDPHFPFCSFTLRPTRPLSLRDLGFCSTRMASGLRLHPKDSHG